MWMYDARGRAPVRHACQYSLVSGNTGCGVEETTMRPRPPSGKGRTLLWLAPLVTPLSRRSRDKERRGAKGGREEKSEAERASVRGRERRSR